MEIIHKIDDLNSILNTDDKLRWPSVFVLPGWMKAWWGHFGAGFETFIVVAREQGEVIGLAPFKRSGKIASFIGNEAVCDYLDFVVAKGKEKEFFSALLNFFLCSESISMNLGTLRPDSITATYFLPMAKEYGFGIECLQAGVSYEKVLEDSFQEYLSRLDSKQRREIMRKQKRMEVSGGVTFRMLKNNDVSEGDIAIFLELMTVSRMDKANFLTANMRGFFEDIFREMSSYGALRLGLLNLGKKTIAAVLCFDYNNSMYMYNSGYDPHYSELSPGLISKIYCIRWSIEHQKNTFDFLKGQESYKQRLGGKRVDLSVCQIGRAS